MFSGETITRNWACHYGGRTELQFNIASETLPNGISQFRHGVAFSFSLSQALQTLEPLYSKVRRFNEFLRLYPERFQHMRMWHFQVTLNIRSEDYSPAPIPEELIKENNFVFLGKHQPVIRELDYDAILADFDELLPLYEYTEGGGAKEPFIIAPETPFSFRSGCRTRTKWTIATPKQQEIDVELRHNHMQELLYNRLCECHAPSCVGTEVPTGTGMRIDVVVKLPDGYVFYEIKTDSSPRACLRQAIGQLLEYSFWPKSQGVKRLVIVGSSALDDYGKQYLDLLNERFSLPLGYEHTELTT